MRHGRVIEILIDIEGPRWQADFDAELHFLLQHIEASAHMWSETGFDRKLLLGTDRVPTGILSFHFGRRTELPDRHGWVDDSGPPTPAEQADDRARNVAAALRRAGRKRPPPRSEQGQPSSGVTMIPAPGIDRLPLQAPARSRPRAVTGPEPRPPANANRKRRKK